MHCLCVGLHCSKIPKRLVALFTLEVIDTRMASHVLLKVCHTRESFVTLCTGVFIDALVSLHVIVVALAGFEHTATQIAGVCRGS